MKLIIDISEEDYKYIKSLQILIGRGNYKTIHKNVINLINSIRNGTPYNKVIEEVTELLENEWGYEGMKEDVARIMKGEE